LAIWHCVDFYIVFFGHCQLPFFHFVKIGGSNNIWTRLEHDQMSKVGRSSLPKHNFWEIFKMTLLCVIISIFIALGYGFRFN
jgi:hypothetical protein